MSTANMNPFSPEYQKQLLVKSLKDQADTKNATNASTYNMTAIAWLINAVSARDSGQPIPTIVDPPLKIHIDDNGVPTVGPDAVASKPTLPPPVGVPSSVTIAAVNPPPDRTDQLLNGMATMYGEIEVIKAAVTAIKTKVGA